MTDEDLATRTLERSEGIQLYKRVRDTNDALERAKNSFCENKDSITVRGLISLGGGCLVLYDSIVPGGCLVESGEWLAGGMAIIAAAAKVSSVIAARKNYRTKKQARDTLANLMKIPEYDEVMRYAREERK